MGDINSTSPTYILYTTTNIGSELQDLIKGSLRIKFVEKLTKLNVFKLFYHDYPSDKTIVYNLIFDDYQVKGITAEIILNAFIENNHQLFKQLGLTKPNLIQGMDKSASLVYNNRKIDFIIRQ